ncbi:MAG: flagellin [Alphaproteobacteria bacterium]
MSGGISLTASMRSNLQSLQYTQELFNSVQERLSTGNKVNSALDNPNSYFTAASLNNRANDLDSLMDSMGQGVQTLKAADQGIETLTSLVEQAQSLTTTALDASIIDSKVSGTLKIEDYTDIKEVTGITAGDKFVISSKEDGEKVESNMNRAVSKDTLLSTLSDSLGTDPNSYQFEIVTRGGDNGDKSAVISIDKDLATATVGDLMDAINNSTSVDVTAALDDEGNLVLSSDDNSIVTIRDADYAGRAQGTVDLSTGTLDDSTDGTVAAGSSYTVYVRNAEDNAVVTSTIADATAGTTFNSLSGVTALAGATATINYMLGGTSATLDIVGTSAATTASGITLQNIASAFNSVAGITATVTQTGSDVFLSITDTNGDSVVITGGTTNGASIIAGLGLKDDVFSATITGGMTAGSLATALTNTANGVTASISTNGKLVVSQDGVEKDLTIVGGAAGGKAAVDALFGDTAGATAGVDESKGTSTMASTFGYDDYNIEITMPTAAQTADELVTAINTAATAANLDITASIVDKKLVITDNLGNDLSIFDVNGGETADVLGIAKNDTTGTNARAEYAQQFDDLRTQMNELVQDTGYKGVNLLKGDDLTVIFNESRTSKLEIKGVTLDATGLGIQATENSWKTNDDINAQLEQVEAALETLRSQASTFGNNLAVVQTREDFTQGMIDTLTAGADKLTLADMNEEAANMLALQTRQQLGTNSLSLASQSSQSVLSLF